SDADFLAIHDEVAILGFNSAVEFSVCGIIFQHIRHVVWRNKIVNTYNLDVFAGEGGSECKAADTAKSINTYFRHDAKMFKSLIICRSAGEAAKIKVLGSKTSLMAKGFT